MASATNERVALCTRLAMAHNRLYRAYPVLVDGTYHMEMHGGREFEVIKLNEEVERVLFESKRTRRCGSSAMAAMAAIKRSREPSRSGEMEDFGG